VPPLAITPLVCSDRTIITALSLLLLKLRRLVADGSDDN
jgi:hypothetical protein